MSQQTRFSSGVKSFGQEGEHGRIHRASRSQRIARGDERRVPFKSHSQIERGLGIPSICIGEHDTPPLKRRSKWFVFDEEKVKGLVKFAISHQVSLTG
jgi:hypothetical protein